MQPRNILVFLLLMAATSLHSHGQQVLLHETFSDNAYRWQELKASNVTMEVAAGNYLITNNSSRDVVAEKAMAIDPNRDFKIVCTIKQVKGPKKGRFGLVWGMKDFDNFYAFSISGAGFFNVYTNEDQDVFNIKKWTFTEDIKRDNEDNTLEIRKENEDIRFFINGQQVYYRAFDAFFGSKLGFLASPGVELAVDFLEVSQDPVSIQVNPALAYSTPREALNRNINSEYKDTSPFLTSNGNTLFFVREKHPENAGLRQRMDIWFSEKATNGEWGLATPAGEGINNKYDNYVAGVNGEQLLVGETYFTKRTYDVGLAIAERTEEGWQLKAPFKIADFYSNSPQVGYCLSADGETLLMTLERDDSFGGRDVYISQKQEDGTWNAPQNMGSVINTPADEVSAFLSHDKTTLYYATQGKPGYGGTDIFMAKRTGSTWNSWSEPQNMGPEVNTPGAESGFFIPENSEFAYFDSNTGSSGSSDIFRIRLPEVREVPEENSLALATEDIQTTITVTGYAINSLTQAPVSTEIVYKDLQTGKVVATAITDPNSGKYEVLLPNGRQYEVAPKGAGLNSSSTLLELNAPKGQNSVEQPVNVLPTEKGNIIRMEGLLFDANHSKLSKAAMIELGRIAIFMAKNPSVSLEIGGHTDNTGSEALNERLSWQRAEAVANFLKEVGIKTERLNVKGYSLHNPLTDNATEEAKALNRRVEFKLFTN